MHRGFVPENLCTGLVCHHGAEDEKSSHPGEIHAEHAYRFTVQRIVFSFVEGKHFVIPEFIKKAGPAMPTGGSGACVTALRLGDRNFYAGNESKRICALFSSFILYYARGYVISKEENNAKKYIPKPIKEKK